MAGVLEGEDATREGGLGPGYTPGSLEECTAEGEGANQGGRERVDFCETPPLVRTP